jgi:hypothetical protein
MMTIKELLVEFPNAIVIDFNKKNVWFLKDDKVKTYPEKYFNKLVANMNIDNFQEDRE